MDLDPTQDTLLVELLQRVTPMRVTSFFRDAEAWESLASKALPEARDFNLLIYFDPTLQRKLLPLFHYCLRGCGVLMLGSSETIGRSGHLWAAIDSRQRRITCCCRSTLPRRSCSTPMATSSTAAVLQ